MINFQQYHEAGGALLLAESLDKALNLANKPYNPSICVVSKKSKQAS
tara:strand:+ start:569 stop:709 length:141 start_codon:yes stop_codon:yes gene_type:complete